MRERAEEFVPIDLTLRFVLFGLECALGVGLSAPEAERAFREAVEDRVSAKEYVFHESGNLLITGRVDEYEPEEMRLRVEGPRGASAALGRVVELARYHVIRLRRAEA
jgi:hypothetical protein